MKKIIASVAAFMCALSMTASATVMEFKMGSTQLNVQSDDGTVTAQTLDVAPYTVNDRTVVPVRVISESFGASVAWDEATETVTIIKDDTVIKLTIGKTTATVNGSEVALDVAPFTENGRTLVPVRFVTEGLGYDVTYEEFLETVLITDEEAAMIINGEEVSRAEYKAVYDSFDHYGIENKEELANLIDMLFANTYVLMQDSKVNGFDTSRINEEIKMNYDYELYSNEMNLLETVYAQTLRTSFISAKYRSQLIFNGREEVTEEEIDKYYQDNYATIRWAFVPVLDTPDDIMVKAPLAAKEFADAIYNELVDGKDFDQVMNEYSEQRKIDYTDKQVTIAYDTYNAVFEDVLFSLDEGGVSEPKYVEEIKAYLVVKREPLEELADEYYIETIKSDISEGKIELIIDQKMKEAEIVRNEEVINSIIGK